MRLERALKLTAARPLWTELAAARGRPVTIDASQVEHLGALCLQTLLAARRAWEKDGCSFEISAPSAEFLDALRLMGAYEHFFPTAQEARA